MNTATANRPTNGKERQTRSPERILQRLDWHVIRRLDGILQGDYRSLFYGTGLDFADLREYQPGDDIRNIDWNVTARMNSPYVRQYIEDREVTAWFLLDFSPSMGFGALERDKESVLVDFVATLARLLTRNGNRVGAIFFDSRVELTIPARSGRTQVLRLINDMLKRRPAQSGSITDLTPLLNAALNSIKQRSLIFLISDFICAPGWDSSINLLSRRHDLIPIRLWDRREIELPEIGIVLVEDLETGEQIYIDTHNKKYRQRFYAAAQSREKQLTQTFKQAGVNALSLSTEEDLVQAILRFAEMRKRARHYGGTH
ncbi:MAG: DUF58 domain-containing protein [Anaerolineales bacterium]|nr:DUF58 domain-containing protein [Anaerolineales bacterium]